MIASEVSEEGQVLQCSEVAVVRQVVRAGCFVQAFAVGLVWFWRAAPEGKLNTNCFYEPTTTTDLAMLRLETAGPSQNTLSHIRVESHTDSCYSCLGSI